MTGIQKIFFGIGALAIVGLGILVFMQTSAPTAIAPTTTMKQGGRSDVTQGTTKKAAEKPVTPEDATLDILAEADEDNSALSEEELGEISEIESEGNVVSDFGTIYDENEN